MKPNYRSHKRNQELRLDVIERFQSLGLEMGKIHTLLDDNVVSRKFFKGDASIVVLDLERGQTVFAAWRTQ